MLILGQGSSGSYALGTIKNSLTAAAIESMLDGIVEAFNKDLIQHLYKLNNFNPARACTLDYDNLQEADIETLSKAWQRLGATGYIPKTLDVVNKALDMIGIDELPSTTTEEELKQMLPDSTSKSGSGMKEGLPSGTGSALGGGDTSSMNSENSA